MKKLHHLGQSILIKYKQLLFIYEINTTQNKASLWKSCVEQGIFENIPSSYQPQIQVLFESMIRQFNNDGLELSKSNQIFLRDFKIELMKLTNTPIPTKSFEETNNEYNKLFQPDKPEKIDFNKEMDTPLKDIEKLLKEKADQRLLESQNYFKDIRTETIVEQTHTEVNSIPEIIRIPQEMNFPHENRTNDKTDELIKMMKQQHKILSGILESQIKIIELLQKK